MQKQIAPRCIVLVECMPNAWHGKLQRAFPLIKEKPWTPPLIHHLTQAYTYFNHQAIQATGLLAWSETWSSFLQSCCFWCFQRFFPCSKESVTNSVHPPQSSHQRQPTFLISWMVWLGPPSYTTRLSWPLTERLSPIPPIKPIPWLNFIFCLRMK